MPTRGLRAGVYLLREEMTCHEQQASLANMPMLELVCFDSKRFIEDKKDVASGRKLALGVFQGESSF